MTRMLLAAFAALLTQNAWAVYPDRPVRIIVPFAAGTGTDTVARAAAAALSKRMGITVSVENQADGTAAVAKAAPDGYTLLATSNPFTIAPYLGKGAEYDPTKDFVAVARIATIPLVLVVNGKSRFKSVDDLVAGMRQNPGKLRYATSGKGALNHLEIEGMAQHFKVQAQDQAFASDADAMAAAAGGQADFFLANLSMALPQIKSGAVRALAVSSASRSEALPNVPTLAQAMHRPNYESSVWFGLFAPRGTPLDPITRIEDDLERELQDAAVRGRIESVGGRVAFARSAPLAGQVGYEYRKWGEVAKTARAMQ